MTKITRTTSKRKFNVGFYLSIIICCGLGLIMFKEFSDSINSSYSLRANDYFPLVFGCFSFFLVIYIVFSYFKKSPTIAVDIKQISFSAETFYWSAVTKIDLTGKWPYNYLFQNVKEGARFTFNDDSVKYFFDDMYSNSWQIKSFIQLVIINKQESDEILINNVEPIELRSEIFENFKGNQFTSIRGIILWGGFFYFAFNHLSRLNLFS